MSIIQILDADGIAAHLSWIDDILKSDHILSPGVSWIPEKPGTYSITTFSGNQLVIRQHYPPIGY